MRGRWPPGSVFQSPDGPAQVILGGVADVNRPAPPVDEMLVADDGPRALLRCVGPKDAGLGEQLVELERPSRLVIRRQASRDLK